MLRSTRVAALVTIAACLASTAKADRLSNYGWRWTSWNVRPPVQAAPVVPAPTPAPVVEPPVAPAPTPAPVYVAPIEPDPASSRFAATNPTPAGFFTPAPNPPATSATYVASAPVAPAPTPQADAFLNFGSGPFPDASLMTVGQGRPWYDSPVVEKAYGGVPSTDQRAEFTNDVLNVVKGVYARSGVQNISFTTDPTVGGKHTMSVASGLSYPENPDVIGITNVGQSGVTLIDRFTAADSPNELAVAVGNNISHELMHAFGVPDHPHETGDVVDAADATWETLTNPNATLSPEAVQAILSHEPSNGLAAFSAEMLDGPTYAMETLAPTPVPEPATVVLWSALGMVAYLVRRRRDVGR